MKGHASEFCYDGVRNSERLCRFHLMTELVSSLMMRLKGRKPSEKNSLQCVSPDHLFHEVFHLYGRTVRKSSLHHSKCTFYVNFI